jgi:hypothetical protein
MMPASEWGGQLSVSATNAIKETRLIALSLLFLRKKIIPSNPLLTTIVRYGILLSVKGNARNAKSRKEGIDAMKKTSPSTKTTSKN